MNLHRNQQRKIQPPSSKRKKKDKNKTKIKHEAEGNFTLILQIELNISWQRFKDMKKCTLNYEFKHWEQKWSKRGRMKNSWLNSGKKWKKKDDIINKEEILVPKRKQTQMKIIRDIEEMQENNKENEMTQRKI